VGVQENPSAPPETSAFLKARRCNRLQGQFEDANREFHNPAGNADLSNLDDANLALARAKSLGCSWAGGINFTS
jgi:hypothetical protein